MLELLAQNGLERGKNDLKIVMMSELPTNALLADQYLEYFDGMSIGSNDMTQLTLGLDRDSALVAELFDERDCLAGAETGCRGALGKTSFAAQIHRRTLPDDRRGFQHLPQ